MGSKQEAVDALWDELKDPYISDKWFDKLTDRLDKILAVKE
jgi:hypothetical protein